MANDFGFAILVVILGRFFHYMDGDFGALHWLLLLLLLLQHLVLLADPLADPSIDPLSLSLLVCPCVGVFGFMVSVVDFVVDFLIFMVDLVVDFWFCVCVCGSVCIRGRRRWWGRWFCRWRREREKRSKLEIIKIMYRRATVTVHICTVTVALVHLCTILHALMWVFFWSKCVKWVTFYILQDYPWTDVVALIHRFLHL